MTSASIEVPSKINLALVVGRRRADGLHEIASVMQRIDLCDRIGLEPGHALVVHGFPEDTLVRDALRRLAQAAGVEPNWQVRLDKRVPVAAGLGGGSADAAAALTLANDTLATPLAVNELKVVATAVGSDVPFFLDPGPKLVEGVGEHLTPLDLPQEFWVVLAAEEGAVKHATAEVYARFDALPHSGGFRERRAALLEALARCRRARDLAHLPGNDLALAAGGSQLPRQLLEAGAFRADVSGAGPTAYGLFDQLAAANDAASALPPGTRTWVVAPVW